MRRILVTGGFGQLGQAIYARAGESSNRYIIAPHAELDIRDYASIEKWIINDKIDTIINCAAYTDVEGAEEHPDAAYAINSDALHTLTSVCQAHNVKLIHISTDYVFGGDNQRATPYSEDDATAPINTYGRSKAAGEEAVLQLCDGVVIRTSWLYAPWGKNFVLTMLRLAAQRREICVVDDQRGTPTSALGLADMLVTLINSGEVDTMAGIYHYTDDGDCTWCDFARAIMSLAGSDCHITPCSSRERGMKVERPTYSVLDKSRIRAIRGVNIIHWRERLKDVMNIIDRSL